MLYIVVCTVACTASTVPANVHGGLFEPLASESLCMGEHYYTVGTFSIPTATTLPEGNVGLAKRSCHSHKKIFVFVFLLK